MNLYLRLLLMSLRARAGRGGRPLSIWDTAVTAFRVAPTDLDVLGHMNNGRYASLFDLGRFDLLVRTGIADDVFTAEQAARQAEVMLVIGTSGAVWPAAGLAAVALVKKNGSSRSGSPPISRVCSA